MLNLQIWLWEDVLYNVPERSFGGKILDYLSIRIFKWELLDVDQSNDLNGVTLRMAEGGIL